MSEPSIRRHRQRKGLFLVMAGPDGVGKTTVASALTAMFPGPTAYVHFRPPLRGTLPARPPPVAFAPAGDKQALGGTRLLGLARLIRSFCLFWIGYLRTVRPALRTGALVVADRWAYGYLVQPQPLGFKGPRIAALTMLRLLPQPDLVAILSAPSEDVHARKRELTLQGIAREFQAWERLPVRNKHVFASVGDPEQTAAAILRAVTS